MTFQISGIGKNLKLSQKNNPDGIIPAYVGLHPHSIYGNNYAFLKLDNNKVTGIQEKNLYK